jgi:metal-responsive CopG/Arc/MetJ family transcriptional regulator
MRTVSLKLPDPLHEQLAAAATRRGTSKSSLVREALLAYLDGETAGNGRSVLDLVANLAGCVEGPKDLSTGMRHMTGFGR